MKLSSFFFVNMYTLHEPTYSPAGCYRYRTWSLVLRFRVFETRVLGGNIWTQWRTQEFCSGGGFNKFS